MHVSFRVKQVYWLFPGHSFKLNTDGSSRGNPGEAAGGGILRDGQGSTIFVFSDYFGTKTSLQAEALALLLGILICKALHIQDVQIECDSATLINLVTGKTKVLWRLHGVFKRIDRCRQLVASYSHCYREANRVADALANLGQQSHNFLFSQSGSKIPNNIKSLIHQDLIGLCNLRFY